MKMASGGDSPVRPWGYSLRLPQRSHPGDRERGAVPARPMEVERGVGSFPGSPAGDTLPPIRRCDCR
jgi:hypothetical protein